MYTIISYSITAFGHYLLNCNNYSNESWSTFVAKLWQHINSYVKSGGSLLANTCLTERPTWLCRKSSNHFGNHSVLRELLLGTLICRVVKLPAIFQVGNYILGMHNFVQIYDDFSFELTFIQLQLDEIIHFMFDFSEMCLKFLCAHFLFSKKKCFFV